MQCSTEIVGTAAEEIIFEEEQEDGKFVDTAESFSNVEHILLEDKGEKEVECQTTSSKVFSFNCSKVDNKKKFSCFKCAKQFNRRSNLEEHERTHTGAKPFNCSLCDKKFRTSRHLSRHEKVHTGDKPFSCPRCDKTFKTSCDRKSHERIHTGVKPFSCSKCNKKFTQPGNLKVHERNHRAHQ